MFKLSFSFYICFKHSPHQTWLGHVLPTRTLKSNNHFQLFTGEDLKTNS
jgi:hypothetical protein